MTDERKLAHHRLLEILEQPVLDGLKAIPEAEAVVAVIPWAMNLNYPPGLVFTRDGNMSIATLFACRQQLMRMLEHLDRVLINTLESGPKDAGRPETTRDAPSGVHSQPARPASGT